MRRRRRKLNKYSCRLSYARTLLKLCKDDDNIGDEESGSCFLVGVQDIIFPHSFIQKVQQGHHLFRYKSLGISWYAEASELQRLPLGRDLDLKHIVRNESVALFALFFENHQNYRYPKPDLYEMWVTDDDSNGAWTKQLTIDERTECPPEMFPQTYHIFSCRSDEFLMVHCDGRSVCFNLCTTKLMYIPIETLGEFVGYVNSRVSVMGRNHKPESMENNCSDKDEDAIVVVDGKRESCRRRYTYSVSAIQPADVSHRIKKVMEVLRAEFGACPCKQFYAIFKPPLREVDGRRRGKKLENWLMLWMDEGITSLTLRYCCFTRLISPSTLLIWKFYFKMSETSFSCKSTRPCLHVVSLTLARKLLIINVFGSCCFTQLAHPPNYNHDNVI